MVVELAKVGLTTDDLILDIHDVRELRLARRRLRRDDLLRLALTYFGDEGNPQPENRSDWVGERGVPAIHGPNTPTFRTPDWGRLPRLEDDQAERKSVPRHRPPVGLPVGAVRELEALLAGRRRSGKPTQDKIAHEVERLARKNVPFIKFGRNRVEQAEQLQKLGWPLLRSQPEFSADDGFVYWPTAAKAARILASERSAHRARLLRSQSCLRK